MRRGSAAWCGLPQSPPGDRGTSGGEPSPSAIRFLPAGASTDGDGDGDLPPRLLLVWDIDGQMGGTARSGPDTARLGTARLGTKRH